MATAISTKLQAKLIASVDLDTLFPAPSFKGLVAFDIHVERGEISPGKKVFLANRLEKEEVTITGIEMKSDPADTKKVRIVCSKPKTIKIPLADNGEWTISEE